MAFACLLCIVGAGVELPSSAKCHKDGRFNMPATLPSTVVLHHGGVTVETYAGVMWGPLEEP